MSMDPELRNFLLDHSLEGIIVTDMEGNILHCNSTADDLLGYTELELKNEFVGIVFPERSIAHLLPNLLHIARSGTGFDGDIILEDSSGEGIMVRMSVQVWSQTGPSCLLLRFIDWRETHRIMCELRDSNQLASLGTLTRSLSHEIRNPVSVIGAYARRLLDSAGKSPEDEEWALQVMSGVEKLESMMETVENFLHLPSPSFEKYPLDNVINSALTGIREGAEEQGVRINREHGRPLPSIFMDPALLETAFSAVMHNALDRMPKGGELTLCTDHDRGHCRLTFRDTGPALDTSRMEEDLSPLHVIGAHRTHLNLAIARRIVDEHGGRFGVGSSDNGGLKITISLPTDRRALAREREM